MAKIVNPQLFGVSFSLKQCNNFGVGMEETLEWLIKEAGFRRFRLMSYWNEHERRTGEYDFTALDKQIEMLAKENRVVTLCLGVRQPRWPENHWPNWAWKLPKAERNKALFRFIEEVVRRYRDNPAIVSYQLENEALLKSFGLRPDVDRPRLRREYNFVKALDPDTPIIMSTSTSWGIPLRRPIPDIVGFSYYQLYYNSKKKRYDTALHTPLLHRTRAHAIRLIWQRPVFIHELQLEPWGPTAIWKMPPEQQDESMGPAQIAKNVALARAVGRPPIDLWGGEWWYWRLKKYNDPSIWHAVKSALDDKH